MHVFVNFLITLANQSPRQGSLAGGRLAFEQQQQQQSVVTSVTFPFSADSSKLPIIQSQSQSTEAFSTTSGFDTPRPSSPVSSDATNRDDGKIMIIFKRYGFYVIFITN